MSARYIIGIDLGTTNCVVAYAELAHPEPATLMLEIPQYVAAGTMESRGSLPSFLYSTTSAERAQDVFSLPWQSTDEQVVGELARRNAAELPDRVIGAAKSWLAYERVDRRSRFLPLNAEQDERRWSPVEATEHYLRQLVAAWNEQHPDAPFCDQQLVVTVPASFDASARELTREAIASLQVTTDWILLEEPQAALYAWIEKLGNQWREKLSPGACVLVCDVGGGTSDFSLIDVVDDNGQFSLDRRAVGHHLLVGGDNMDLALAHQASVEFESKGVTLDPWQAISLWHSCRDAKEQLLAGNKKQKLPISVKKKGRRLIGGTATVQLQTDQVRQFLLDGFFPLCTNTDRPEPNFDSGFQELGLPYEADTAITRHLSAFLHDQALEAGAANPTHILFNGGVFQSSEFRDRVIEVVQSWNPDQTIEPLDGDASLDHAVARGAAYYGWAKQNGGVRIRGGAPHAYYVGIQTSGLSIPGAPRPMKAVCVVPIGMEEGTQCSIPNCEVGLVIGKPARFRFFKSSIRHDDEPGSQLMKWTKDELEETAPLETTLEASEELADPYLAVQFVSNLTELGVLELWCESEKLNQRWKLEFSIRN